MLEFYHTTVVKYNTKMLNELNLKVEDGMLLGLIGDNNLSKSLLLKAGAGIIAPDIGDVLLDGFSVFRDRKRIHRRVGFMPDTFGFYERLKVEEYYELFLSLYGFYGSSRAKRVDEVLDLVDLHEERNELIGTLPVEKLAFLSLGQTILHSPDWIFLDEPFNVMGSSDRNRMARILFMLQEEGASILVNTNMYQELSDLFTHVAILEEGRLMTMGRPNDVYKHVINGQPVRMQVIDGMDQAIAVLKDNPKVERVTIDGMVVIFRFSGNEEDEARLLSEIVASGALIRNYNRELLNMEEIFQGTRIR